ncbi:MAG: RNA polymerase factor sigma-70 [Pseudomonadota bacterium]|nr:RNA polymerase factor sigma-70 [Pseudomonadota bacterium]
MTEVLDRPAQSPATPLIPPSLVSAGNAWRPVYDVQPATESPAQKAACPARTLLDIAISNRPMLVNMARGFVGCGSRAEDVVHDVFIKLIDFPNQDAVRQPAAYVARMVRNASIDACRSQTLENTYHADEDDGLDVPSPQCTPEVMAETRDTLRQVMAALEQLPARCRAAFEMVRLREETLKSTASALNVSQTLVHFMVRDAEKHCVDSLDACHRGDANPRYFDGCARRR